MTKITSAAAEPAVRIPPNITRALAAAAYIAIGMASLVPKALRPSTGIIPGAAEHFCAYFVLGIVTALAFRERTSLRKLAALNAIYAGILEIGQIFVPGRVSTPVDFAASALGSCAAIALLALWRRKAA